MPRWALRPRLRVLATLVVTPLLGDGSGAGSSEFPLLRSSLVSRRFLVVFFAAAAVGGVSSSEEEPLSGSGSSSSATSSARANPAAELISSRLRCRARPSSATWTASRWAAVRVAPLESGGVVTAVVEHRPGPVATHHHRCR